MCTKFFALTADLNKHIVKCTKNHPKDCPKCGTSRPTLKNLMSHTAHCRGFNDQNKPISICFICKQIKVRVEKRTLEFHQRQCKKEHIKTCTERNCIICAKLVA